MKANELRIGNFVRRENNLCAVIGYYDDIFIAQNFDKIEFKSNVFDLKPIPLTEEWLLKFGFEKNDNNQFILMEGSVDILFNKDLNGWTCDGINFSINMTEHVHQLQNLYFALTGEELILNA